MSIQTALARPLPAPGLEPVGDRRLHAVDAPAPRRKPRLVYGLVAVIGALAIVGAQMVLSVMTTQTSYQVAQLNTQQRQLTWQKQILDDEVAGLSSPQYIAANAAALGMVGNESPSYLPLSDGTIVGASKKASGRSSINPLGRGAVANRLIADTPLVTDPHATIDGTGRAVTTKNVTPVPVTDGLPTVRTH